jgi:Transglycosylase SLT domain
MAQSVIEKPSGRDLFIMILLAFSLSLSLLLAIGPAIEITFEEPLVQSSNSSQNNLMVNHLSTSKSDPIGISNSVTSNNNDCSTGWYVEGYSFSIESDPDGRGYAQTITIHSLNDTNNAITGILKSEFLQNIQIRGWGVLTKQGDYIGAWNDQFWDPISSPAAFLRYPLVVGTTSKTDESLLPYGGIFTIPTQVRCNPDPAITTTNISVGDPMYDQFDSYIINATNQYGITDKMMVKAMILQESSFDIFAVSPDIPCGVPNGWTKQESRSFGLMQVTPACIDHDGGRPNLTTDNNSSNWATSWFNPEYNINQGVKSLADNLLLMKSKFSGCSNEQYMLMALGAYNSGEGAIKGCGEWNDRADRYITSVTRHHRNLSQMANHLNAG